MEANSVDFLHRASYKEVFKLLTKSVTALTSFFISCTALADHAEQNNLFESPQQYCKLKPEADYGKIPMGSLETIASPPGWIGFSPKVGRIVGKRGMFNLDSLYEMSNGTESARFRINETNFINGSSYIGNMAWVDGKSLTEPGFYRFYEVKTKKKIHEKSITMVGDSITWWSSGRYFRCMLEKQIPDIGFTGPHTDIYGFGHAGEGGNKTKQIIARINKIKRSDYYFILAGTNDWQIKSPQKTVKNIKIIANYLSKKGGSVIISTLLPRMDKHDATNVEVNKLLRTWNGKGCNCQIVDLDQDFRKLENKDQYYWDAGLHPNIEGYKKIVEILAPKIERAINQGSPQSVHHKISRM
jgi:lysophospholipase L1-like esterase